MTKRPTWDSVWMAMAENIGHRSRCVRANAVAGGLGCVIVTADNQVVSASYVGPPAGYGPANADPTSTCEQWCPRAVKTKDLDPGYTDCVSSHAEQSAIARADFSRTAGGTIYVNSSVCQQCAKLVATAKVARVVMRLRESEQHRGPEKSIEYLRSCGITVEVFP